MDYDALRAAHPELRISVYGMTPGSVTLEIITPDDMVFPFVAPTLTGAIEMAFPPPEEPPLAIRTEGVRIRKADGAVSVIFSVGDTPTDADVSDVTPEPNIFD